MLNVLLIATLSASVPILNSTYTKLVQVDCTLNADNAPGDWCSPPSTGAKCYKGYHDVNVCKPIGDPFPEQKYQMYQVSGEQWSTLTCTSSDCKSGCIVGPKGTNGQCDHFDYACPDYPGGCTDSGRCTYGNHCYTGHKFTLM